MKVLILMLLMTSVSIKAVEIYSQTTLFNMQFKNELLKDVIDKIESNSEFIFFYRDDILKLDHKVNLEINNESINVILDKIFSSTDIEYEIFDRQIIIKKKELVQNNQLIIIENKEKTVKKPIPVMGRVVDDEGVSIPGVAVIIKGSTTGTTTDINGNFSITIPDYGVVLLFSFMGMETQEITYTAEKGYLTVNMQWTSMIMEEVVVVGYGIQRKESVVGAISTAKGEELLRAGGATTVSNTLAGLLPGMVTINTSGKPGSDQAQLIIRGVSTWNNSDPLILIDGIERDMDDINVAEIETISMLKDASATAVFGVRGANGVILITTKRGVEGKPRLRFGANTTFKDISKIPQYANSYESRWLRNQVIEMQVNADEATWADYTPQRILEHYRLQDEPFLYPDVDWQDIMLRNSANSQRYDLDIQGGTQFVKYFSSLSYVYDGDMIKGEDLGFGFTPSNDYSRLNLRTNLDFQPTQTTSFSVDLDGSFANDNRMWQTTVNPRRLWLGIYGKAPDLYPVFYEDGTLGYSDIVDPQQENIYYAINYLGMVSSTVNNVSTSINLKQDLRSITKGLNFHALFNFNNRYSTTGPSYGKVETALKYIDPSTNQVYYSYPEQWGRLTHGFNFVEEFPTVQPENVNSNVLRNLQYQASLRYNRQFGKHEIGGLALFQRLRRAIGSAFPSFREEWAGRFTYAYDSRYLVEGNMGYNGSENFGKGYKFGLFPSYAFGWVVSNEPFYNLDFMNLLKFRFSSGKVGNDSGIPRWLYTSSWVPAYNYRFGIVETTTPFQAYSEGVIANPNARWETAIKSNVAIETAFFKNQFRASFDYFWGNRKDIFMSADRRNIPPWFGAPAVAANLGETEERGWELETTFNKSLTKDFRLTIASNLAYVTSKVIYAEDPELMPDYQKNAGFPIGQVRSIMYDQIINSWDDMYTGVNSINNIWALPGDFRMIDYNGDGIIDERDAVPYGYANRPQYVFSLTPTVRYKGIQFSVQLYGMTNHMLSQYLAIWGVDHNLSVDRIALENAWIPGREETATLNRPRWKYSSGGGHGHYNFVDGTTWRIRTAELSYTFTPGFLKIDIESIRVFVNGTNLWLFNYLNEDRDRTSQRAQTGTSWDSYPIQRMVNFGLNITF